MTTKKFGPFPAGMNNIAPDYGLPKNQNGVQIAVRDAQNVDFLDTGHYRLRTGYRRVHDMAGAHSLFCDGLRTFLVRDSVLYQVASFSPYAEVEIQALTSDARMSYVADNGEVWCSNGVDFGRVSSAGTWLPHAQPTPSGTTLAAGVGTLPAGRYAVAVTAVGVEGDEGGAEVKHITLSAEGGIEVALPALDVFALNIYVTTENGGVPLYATQVPGGTLTATLATPASGRALRTEKLQPLPAGRLAMHNGRLLSWAGAALHFSEPFNLGLCNPVAGFIPFKGDVSNVVPAQNGVYVVADKTYWFAGTDIANPEIVRDVLPYGGVAGTSFADTEKQLYGWFGTNGLVIATAAGEVKAIQEEHVAVDSAQAGAILIREAEGLRHAIVVLQGEVTTSPVSRHHDTTRTYSINMNTGATSRYLAFEFNSMAEVAGGYCHALASDGLYELSGTMDSGDSDDSIVTVLDIGLQNFGSLVEKRVSAIYINAASEMPATVVVGVAGDEYSYTARSSSAHLDVHRFDVGRGLRANNFGFRFEGEGAIEVEQISFDLVDCNRRV